MWKEKVDKVKRLRLRSGVASEGAHHFLCPPKPLSGRPVCSHFGGAQRARRREARLERRRQLTHQRACPEEERRLLRDPAQPLPGAQEEKEEGGVGRARARGGAARGRRPAVATRRQTHVDALTLLLPSSPARLARPHSRPDPDPPPGPRACPCLPRTSPTPAEITLGLFRLWAYFRWRGNFTFFSDAADPASPFSPIFALRRAGFCLCCACVWGAVLPWFALTLAYEGRDIALA